MRTYSFRFGPLGDAQLDIVRVRFFEQADHRPESAVRIDGRSLVVLDPREVESVLLNAIDIVRDWGNDPEEKRERAATERLYKRWRDALEARGLSGQVGAQWEVP